MLLKTGGGREQNVDPGNLLSPLPCDLKKPISPSKDLFISVEDENKNNFCLTHFMEQW